MSRGSNWARELTSGLNLPRCPTRTSVHNRYTGEASRTCCNPIYSAFCIIAAALLFYRNRLKKPLAELRAASEKIANNDLDFSIDYDSNDELGQLCASFEIMRTTLADNFSKMWRQVEERKALNAAFAHDLRTPLTVLKGYNEMLQASENSQTRETAATMGKHISRMENYVSSMSNLGVWKIRSRSTS